MRDGQDRARPDVGFCPGGQLHPLRDGASERSHPKGLDRHPDLQRPKRAAQLQAAIREVGMVRAPHRVLEHVVVEGEDVLQRAGVLHQQAACLVGLEEPLVGVQPNRIGALNPGQEPFAGLGHDGKATVGGIGVQPDAFRLAVVRHRPQRIDSSGATRSGVCAHGDGIETCGAILGHGLHKRLHVQAEVLVTWNRAHALRSHADDHRPAAEHAMALVAHVHGRPLGRAGRFPRRDKGVDAGRRATAGEKPARALGVAEPAPNPVNDD